MDEEIIGFLNSNNYDVRLSKNARWIDQKCTMDVLSMVSDCIMEFVKDNPKKEFTTKDIWYYEYTVKNVQMIFKKPNPLEKAQNEYDKWFGQPMKLLGYSKVLNETKKSGRNYYTVNDEKILKYISKRDSNALLFLKLYIEKVIKDSGLTYYFDNFFIKQDKDSYKLLKDAFNNFTIANTKINTTVECGRIFAKVLNPLAFYKDMKGTERGEVSKGKITIDMLQYNRYNWRDVTKDKPKDVTRKEFESISSDYSYTMLDYKIHKAKKILKEFNNKYRDGFSEMPEDGVYLKEGTMIHHIFPKADFPALADYLENLIVLTPTQHLAKAHPKGNTSYIDREYQYLLLVCKIGIIKNNLLTEKEEKIYDFKYMIHVLNTGLSTEEFSEIKEMDFENVINHLEFFYGAS